MMVTDEMDSRSPAMKMFDAHAKANAQFGSAWRQPATTYAALAAAQTKASAERRRRDPSEESDVTRQDGGGAATTPYARNVIVDDDDEGPPPEAGVTCACCRAQKDAAVEKRAHGGQDAVQRVRRAVQGGKSGVR